MGAKRPERDEEAMRRAREFCPPEKTLAADIWRMLNETGPPVGRLFEGIPGWEYAPKEEAPDPPEGRAEG